MFGLTLTKILFTVALAVAVWRAWRWWQAFEVRRDRLAAERRTSAQRPRPAVAEAGRDPGAGVEETQLCPLCRTYVPATAARACGRRGCPYPG